MIITTTMIIRNNKRTTMIIRNNKRTTMIMTITMIIATTMKMTSSSVLSW